MAAAASWKKGLKLVAEQQDGHKPAEAARAGETMARCSSTAALVPPADAQPGRYPPSVTRALRTVYDETLREDIPDDFLRLLGQLD